MGNDQLSLLTSMVRFPIIRLSLWLWFGLLAFSFAPATAELIVTLEGLNARQLANVEATLGIARARTRPALSPERIEWLHHKAPTHIRSALEPLGYYAPEVTSNLTRAGDVWHASYVVDPGQPVRISIVDVSLTGSGAMDSNFDGVRKDLNALTGVVLEHQQYEQGKARLQSTALEFGYFNSALTKNEVLVDTGLLSATVILHLETGERFSFGQTRYADSPVSTSLLSRYQSYVADDPYSSHQLLDLQTALVSTGYFRHVSVSPQKRMGDPVVDVAVDLEPKEKREYSIGAGYSTDARMRARVGVKQPLLNPSGHRFETDLFLSSTQSNFSGHYAIPGENPATDFYEFQMSVGDEDSNSIESTSFALGAGAVKQVNNAQRLLSLNYQQERYTFDDEEERIGWLEPSIGYIWSFFDRQVNPREGFGASVELRGAAEGFLSDISFLQVKTNFAWLVPVMETNRLKIRVATGVTFQSDFSELPASLRFFAGGDRSVRGYSHESIGVTSSNGDVLGGRNLLFASIEYEHWFRPAWALVLFSDTGDAFNDTDISLHTGVGVGFRWASPIGPVGVDLAHGVDEPGDSVRFHLSIGPPF